MTLAPNAKTGKFSLFFKDPASLAFLLSFLYWIYLAFSTQMIIVFDGMVYEKLGLMLYKNGFSEYFKTGPNNEPFYPFLISISMRIADFLSVSYQSIQKVMQILFLLSTQVLVFILLRKLNIKKPIAAVTILYVGISPAIVNSAFSLWSEIVTYPFVLGIIFVSVQSLKSIPKDRFSKVLGMGLLLSFIFIILTITKAVFQLIILIYLLPFAGLAIRSLFKKQKKLLFNSMGFVLVVLLSYHLFVAGYKSLNFRYNGHYAFTDRGPWALYGNTARRMEKLTGRRFLSGLVFASGEGACKSMFSEKECEFWSYKQSDHLGYVKLNLLQEIIEDPNEVDRTLIYLSIQQAFSNPFQYLLLAAVENSKLLFWESTKIGFVTYPSWLAAIFDFSPFKNGLRLFTFCLTFLALIYTVRYAWKSRSKPFVPDEKRKNANLILASILLLTFAYMGAYSLFFILTRYALPLAPLYLTGIAFSLQKSVLEKTL